MNFTSYRPVGRPVNVPCRKTITCNRFELFNAMLNRTPITLGDKTGIINAIEMEDGSGHCFNVRLYTNNTNYTLFVKG